MNKHKTLNHLYYSQMQTIWKSLPYELSRLVIDKYIQNCHKLKAIKLLVKHVLDTMQEQHRQLKIRDTSYRERISFSISTIKDTRYWNNIECLLHFDCVFIKEKHKKPSDIVLSEYTTTEFIFGFFNEKTKVQAHDMLYKLLIKLFDSASENKFNKPFCNMSIDILTPLSLPACNDLYDNNF